MSIINSQPLIGASGQGGGYNIERSLRFRSSASAYLNRTPASAGNRKTWTWSGWVKISKDATTAQYIFTGNSAATDAGFLGFGFSSAATNFVVTGWNTNWRITTQAFRDFSAWYHIVVVLDTTQATANDRVKIYVNGVQVTSFSTTNNPTQNADLGVNTAAAHYFSSYNGINELFEGYMTEVNFIDGQALTPTSFGETDVLTGVWKPKKYAGTYGTNGFYLPFSNNASTTTLGNDFSGNGNNWTTNNISLTAGATYDSMTDVPTLTSATTANYAVLNPIQKYISGGVDLISATISDGNLKTTGIASSNRYSGATIIPNSGKYYCEITIGATQTGNYIGFLTIDGSLNYTIYYANGTVLKNAGSAGTVATYTANDVIGIAWDVNNGEVTFYKNGTSQSALTGVADLSRSAVMIYQTTNTDVANANFGQRPFAYTPPTGFVALNTFNLPEPSIKAGNKQFDINTYTGTGTTNVIVNSGSMQPDFVWAKRRSSAASHGLVDSVRGTGRTLFSNLTDAEDVGDSNLTAFNSNGFTAGSGGNFNTSGQTYVAWQWKANGAAVTNTAGTITSQVSANTTAGFSIVTYTGTGANATIGHGLGVAPKLAFVKRRNSTSDWSVYYNIDGFGAGVRYLLLNGTGASVFDLTYWNGTAATSSVLSLGTAGNVNTSSGTYVAYCWSEVAGYSKFGSYTGNGSTDGVFIFTGFRSRYVMFKRVDSGSHWVIYDTSRNTFNFVDSDLAANNSNAENGTVASESFDILSNGIKIRSVINGEFNVNGGTYIYMAFAENPFKNSLAR
jgi:hypothetical protein